MMVNLAGGMAGHGAEVHLVLKDAPNLPFIADIARHLENGSVRVFPLQTAGRTDLKKALAAYIAGQNPDALLSARIRNGHDLAVSVCRQMQTGTRVYLRIATHVSRRGHNQSWFRRLRERRSLCRAASRADGIISVSRGVAADFAGLCGIDPAEIRVLPNPVVAGHLHQMAQEPLCHPWFAPGEPPVVLGAGGFRNQKDFPTLLRAFARVRETIPARLVILGTGRLKHRMISLARSLGISADMHLPGFVQNPYAYMARAGVFALSSRWEGSPNVLVEALAVGTPVVAADCPGGPREVLEDGFYGRLIRPGDPGKMAEALLQALKERPERKRLMQGALHRYSARSSAAAYLCAFGLASEIENSGSANQDLSMAGGLA
jgi:glycosyltransferase involved in cell wall biosynthesis